jgi:hypothetical protein
MLQYPSIMGSAKSPIGKPCIAFVKYDGSNLRWEWSPKKGWNKFGTRHQLFDASAPLYNQAIPLFMSGMGDELVYRTKQIVKNPERITAFTEFLGPSSFAGQHVEDEQKELRLFDVFLFKKGFVPPTQFVDVYGSMPQSAEIVYTGNLDKQFIMDIRSGKYDVFEGVVAKGSDFMVKIKTDQYFEKLRNKYADRWLEFAE